MKKYTVRIPSTPLLLIILIVLLSQIVIANSEDIKVPVNNVFGVDHTFYVSPKGKASANGSKTSPFRTLQQAMVKLEKFTESNKTGQIIIKAGTYNFERSISLNKISNLRIMAHPGENVYFSGGVTITREDLKPVSDNHVVKRLPLSHRKKIVSIDLSKFGIITKPWHKRLRGYAGWPEVFINDKALQLARWPNSEYSKVGQVLKMGGMLHSRTGDKILENDSVGTFKYTEDRPGYWDDSQDLYLKAYFAEKWVDEIVRVRRIDKINSRYGMLRKP